MTLQRGLALVLSVCLVVDPGCAPTSGTGYAPQAIAPTAMPPPGTTPPFLAGEPAATASAFNSEQLDAMLASIALYPDELLMKVLMASTYPLEIAEASRWLASGNNKDLKGDVLAEALAPLPWDPSVKSLVPFPRVLEQMAQHLEWTEQIGYAVAQQQNEVMDSIQRLRRQAQSAGTLKTTEQQVVSTLSQDDSEGNALPGQTIIIQPASPQTVYVPVYDPFVMYGGWPYPAYPPVYYPPPPEYYLGTGLAFMAGVAVVGGLWGWAGANWGCCGGGAIYVNHNRYNNISVNNPNRGNFNGSRWQARTDNGGRGQLRSPGGPVGNPGRVQNLPANAIGRGNVQVPGGAVNRPNIGGGPGDHFGGGGLARGGQSTTRVAAQTPGGGAFSGMRDGSRTGQFQQRGAQSMGIQRSSGGFRGGGGFRSGSRGGFRGGGRGGRR